MRTLRATSREREAIAEPLDYAAAPPLQRRLAVELHSRGADHTLVLYGSLELDSLGSFDAAVRPLWEMQPRTITLDLRNLAFIDSSGLWSITSLQKWCLRESVRLRLLRGPDPVHRVFELTGLSDALPFADPA
jgi:anti-anti-sigma factor